MKLQHGVETVFITILVLLLISSHPVVASSTSDSLSTIIRLPFNGKEMEDKRLSNPENFETAQRIATSYIRCGLGEVQSMTRKMLRNRTVTCNDGTTAGYYVRRSYGSRRWIVFLEGGWYCFDRRSCEERWRASQNLMSSSQWKETKPGSGILSADPEENPHWWNANHVFIPYCSSDSWSGTATKQKTGHFAFMGSLIIDEVIREILKQGLSEGKSLILAGSSAGGTGVLLNIDRISDLLQEMGYPMDVKGIADSGWFLDHPPFLPLPPLCHNSRTKNLAFCSAVKGLKTGFKVWKGRVPTYCQMQYPRDEWRCYFGYRIYPTLRAPLFLFQWLYDEAQLIADNVGTPSTKEQWDFIHTVGTDFRASFKNVTAVFSPSCISHTTLTKRNWRKLSINGVTLPSALHCWDVKEERKNIPVDSIKLSMLADAPVKNPVSSLSSSSLTTTKSPRHRQRKEKNRKRKQEEKKQRKNKKRNKKRKERLERQEANKKDRKNKRRNKRKKKSSSECTYHLIDSCSWPQCNRDCPKLQNPATGEEVDLIDLWKSFGLDMRSVANALGIDIHTLTTMENDVLLRLLTQDTN